MWIRAAALFCAAAPAVAEPPLSAIDWLSESVAATPAAAAPSTAPEPPPGPPVSTGAAPDPVVTLPLDGTAPDAAGLLPPSVTGLPRALWGPGGAEAIAARIRAIGTDTLPAGRALAVRLLLAETDPPVMTAVPGTLLLARIDKLLDLGLVEEAAALIERAGPGSPELFRRAFDVALLLGEETRACAELRARPDVTPALPARIFCLARGGDWSAAALTLGTARALGQITPAEEALLGRFLDPELHEGAPPLPAPERATPLVFRLMEALGEPLPSSGLPRAFAHADLRPTAGWKAQVEAAERLARAGAIDPNRLLGIFTERLPAASGGVWDRVAALQRLDGAVAAGDPAAVAAALPGAWETWAAADLLPVLGQLYGPALVELPLAGEARALAFRLSMLSPAYEEAALAGAPDDAEAALMAAVARGAPLPAHAGPPAIVLAGLAPDAEVTPEARDLLAERRFGEAILVALEDLAAGAAGDSRRLAAALALFRRLGLETTARRAALEYLVLSGSA
jgi:hypothetical protein